MSAGGVRKIAYVTIALGSIAALAFFATRRFNWRAFLNALDQVDWTWLTLALVLILATYVGRALRWEVMLKPLAKNASLQRIVSATCIGFTAVVLFGRAGEPVRPYLIARKEGVSFSSQIAAWVVERILDLLMVLIIFGFALSQVSHSTIQSTPRIETILQAGGASAGVIAAACLILLFGLRQFRGQVQKRLLDGLAFLPTNLLARIDTFFTAFGEGMESTRSGSFVLLLVAYTALEWVLIAGSFFCVFHAFPVTAGLGIIDIVMALGFVAFGSVVQIPGLGGGMQIVCVLVLTEFYGIGLEAASSVALTLWVISFVAIVPIGLFLAFHEGLKWRNLRHIETDSQIEAS
jgi:uncharacterized protein (TIRG00374 family)